jgi:hypothetical protein
LFLTSGRKSVTASSPPPPPQKPSKTSPLTSSARRSILPQKVFYGLHGTLSPSCPSSLSKNFLTILSSGLDFTAQGLRHNLTNSSKELSDSFRDAYGNTLKPHHSFVIKPIFSAAMSATPYRKDFYAKLGSDDAKVQAELENWLKALENQVGILRTFTTSKEAKW